MKEFLKKVSGVCKQIFGIGIAVSLFMGALVFLGYVVALAIGGDIAAAICVFLYKKIVPIMIYISTTMVLLGLVAMYLAGELALTANKKKAAKSEGER
ncbi:MAG: hypothetical protein IJW99_07035 [Clostridia bacterium]|nr:hypothetical protein [Clostridia bacterium]